MASADGKSVFKFKMQALVFGAMIMGTGGALYAHYSAAICRLISSLDEGAAFGLSAGGSLRFEARLTEGSPCCRGRWVFKGDPER